MSRPKIPKQETIYERFIRIVRDGKLENGAAPRQDNEDDANEFEVDYQKLILDIENSVQPEFTLAFGMADTGIFGPQLVRPKPKRFNPATKEYEVLSSSGSKKVTTPFRPINADFDAKYQIGSHDLMYYVVSSEVLDPKSKQELMLELYQKGAVVHYNFNNGEIHGTEAAGTCALSLKTIDDLVRVGMSWLHVAGQLGKESVIETLINLGANPNLGSSEGMTPIHYAAKYGQVDAIRILHQKGANLQMYSSARDEVGREVANKNAMHYAVASGETKVVETLLELKPELANSRNSDGLYPIHMAVMKGDLYQNPSIIQHSN